MRAAVVGFALAGVLAGGASGQDPRSLLRLGAQAYDFAEYGAARAFLMAGLNPAAGPRDSLWVASVHRLAHILIEERKDSVAAVWLRWALRVHPGLVVDTVDFPPPVQDAFARARDFVADASSGDTLTETTWEWVRGRGETQSGLRIERSGVAMSGFVEGIGPLPAGETQRVAAGSYTMVVSAPDYFFRARVTREVLPGITTVVRFRLRGLSSQVLGFLYVASTPWGSLYLDGEPTGYTPVAARPVAVGPHRLRIERAGYAPFDTIVTVGRDQRLRLGTIRLRAAGSQR
ncbi:MAG TPA: PEGA domain-containing protein [Gemmatimonadales bacterium]|nr:PEGA domain-containing protein [Gemmatimonadales bacterium]